MKTKIISFLCFALLCVACGSSKDDPDPVTPDVPPTYLGDGLQVVVSTSVIYANGLDASKIRVYYDKQLLSFDQVEFYNAADNAKIADMPASYTTTKAGKFSFWVAYGTASTVDRPTTITAVEFVVPDAPADPQPDNMNFVHRVFLTQFTGLGCGYCPYMIASLEDARKAAGYTDKSVLAACHTYSGDPFAPDVNLYNAMGLSSGYPTVIVDFKKTLLNYNYNTNVSQIKSAIDNALSVSAGAGISVGLVVSQSQLLARVTVKAAEAGSFRVGAWILEDGLKGTQSNYGMTGSYDFNTHNNVVRVIDSRASASNYTGHDIGTLSAGATGDHLFTINIDPSWNAANCHVVFFVSKLSTTAYYLVNVMDVPMKTSNIAFEYE